MSEPAILPNPSQPNIYGPITAGQMFERTFTLLRENFKLFFGIVLILIGVHIVAMGIFGGSEFWMIRSNGGPPSVGGALLMFPIFVIGGVLFFIFVMIIQGSFFVATRARLSGTAMTVGEACKLAADKAGKLTGVALLIIVRCIGYWLLFCIASLIVFLMIALLFGGLHHASGDVPFALGHGASLGFIAMFVVLGLLWLVLYFAFLLWLYARYALSVPAALAENLSVTGSVRRSVELSRGSKGRLYAMLLSIVGAYLVLDAVLVPVEMLAFNPFHPHPVGMGIGMGMGPGMALLFLVISIVSIVMSALVMVFIGIATALCYYDLRVRKEGFGNVTPPPPAVPIAPADGWPLPPNEPTGDIPIS
ncbi:MAG TPA: hypothetical protein VMF56_11720 [Acidobacteriaceae bacterium]|nr:hypothetical protein [Acidobacteriaceae bacterium]